MKVGILQLFNIHVIILFFSVCGTKSKRDQNSNSEAKTTKKTKIFDRVNQLLVENATRDSCALYIS